MNDDDDQIAAIVGFPDRFTTRRKEVLLQWREMRIKPSQVTQLYSSQPQGLKASVSLRAQKAGSQGHFEPTLVLACFLSYNLLHGNNWPHFAMTHVGSN